MIKFIIQDGKNGDMLGIVLEKHNIELLKEGKPIIFNMAKTFGYYHVDNVLVCYFETQEEAMKKLREEGYITDDTVVVNKRGKEI
jgi:hypothetical protein